MLKQNSWFWSQMQMIHSNSNNNYKDKNSKVLWKSMLTNRSILIDIRDYRMNNFFVCKKRSNNYLPEEQKSIFMIQMHKKIDIVIIMS